MQYTEIFLALKIENYQLENRIFFLIFAQNIDCEYPRSMFLSKNKNNRYMYTPAYPSFAVKKWGSKGYTLLGHVFVMRC